MWNIPTESSVKCITPFPKKLFKKLLSFTNMRPQYNYFLLPITYTL